MKKIVLNIQMFTGGGTGTAAQTVAKINSQYQEAVQKIKTTWSDIDNWDSTYTSGAEHQQNATKLAEFISNIPEPSGNNVNAYLKSVTDSIVNSANYQDRVNNKGNAQISNSFTEQHYTLTDSTPATRSYKGVDDFAGITDEGVADIKKLKTLLSQLSTAVDGIFKLCASVGSTGTEITGRDLTSEYAQNINKNSQTLAEAINSYGNFIDSKISSQEDTAHSDTVSYN